MAGRSALVLPDADLTKVPARGTLLGTHRHPVLCHRPKNPHRDVQRSRSALRGRLHRRPFCGEEVPDGHARRAVEIGMGDERPLATAWGRHIREDTEMNDEGAKSASEPQLDRSFAEAEEKIKKLQLLQK